MKKPRVIVVDKNDNFITYKERNDRNPADTIRITSIWIENEKGEILLTQRSLNKKYEAGKWGSAAGGTVDEGETYESNILKEVEEEIGVSLKESDINFVNKYLFYRSNSCFCSQFYAQIHSDSKIILEENEVEDYVWISWEDLGGELTSNPHKFIGKFKEESFLVIQKWKSKQKTILVDAVHTFVNEIGEMDKILYDLLEGYYHKKIIVTNAPYGKFNQFGLGNVPYPVFTLEKNPTKLDPHYFQHLLNTFELEPHNVIYFDHNPEAVDSAKKIGIQSYHFDKKKRDYDSLKIFLDNNV